MNSPLTPLLHAACLAVMLTSASARADEVPPSADPLTLERVLVTTRLERVPAFDVPASTTTVDLGESGHNEVNLSDELGGVPGLLARERQNYAQDTQISIRGAGARATFGVRGIRLYSDGIPATMPDGQGQLSHFNLLGGARVEVLRGPFSALYGNSAGGVIQLWSAAPTHDPELTVQTTYGRDDSWTAGARARLLDIFRPDANLSPGTYTTSLDSVTATAVLMLLTRPPHKGVFMRPNRAYGHLRPPAVAQIQDYAARHRMTLTDEQAGEFAPVIAGILRGFDEIDELPEPPVTLDFHDRDPGRAPQPGEDPYNAFIRFCTVKGAADGPLAGVRAAVKDSIAVAGVPMTNGSRMQPVPVPLEDAVVVERLLAAGATIIGKTNLEDMAMGIGEGSAYGAARNPRDPRFGTGGSSSGSAAAVASGAADIALGADEAGSIRIPASWSGLVGMKATHGLVPSYGMTYMDHTLDHLGPITRSVESNARVLEVIAGEDERDPQWFRGSVPRGSYVAGLDRGVRGMTFGIVQEALAPIGCTPDVLAAFESACDALRNAGATVEVVSVPLWGSAWTIESGVLGFGLRAMIDSGGAGYGHMGRIDTATMQTAVSQMRTSADDLSLMTRLLLIAVEHLREAYLGVHYAKTQNLRLELRRQVEQALIGVDALLTPTTPTVATELLDRRAGFLEMVERLAGSAVLNTCALDLTGHPALSVPAGTGLHGLPVGLQIIGPRLSEANLYRVAAVVEDALPLPAATAAGATQQVADVGGVGRAASAGSL